MESKIAGFKNPTDTASYESAGGPFRRAHAFADSKLGLRRWENVNTKARSIDTHSVVKRSVLVVRKGSAITKPTNTRPKGLWDIYDSWWTSDGRTSVNESLVTHLERIACMVRACEAKPPLVVVYEEGRVELQWSLDNIHVNALIVDSGTCEAVYDDESQDVFDDFEAPLGDGFVNRVVSGLSQRLS